VPHLRYTTNLLACLATLTLWSCTEQVRTSVPDGVEPLPIATWTLPERLTFCGEDVPLHIPEVRERAEREFYVNLQTPGQIILYLKRAGRYFPLYERLLRESGVPDDLKYVSVAESALFMARSPKDAVGLWQFIPATAKAMGLVVTDDVDERRHPERSTAAAIKYLHQGFKQTGSWATAAAGYNMGHENLAENQRFQSSHNYYDLFLNEETSRYILRIAIIKHIMEQAGSYGIALPASALYSPTFTRAIPVEGGIANLAEWAAAQGTTYKDVKLLNPWILKRALPTPPKGHLWVIDIPTTTKPASR
jgi:membrane-bound lytic murein transglycosylase D